MYVVTVSKKSENKKSSEFQLAIWPNESWKTAFHDLYIEAHRYAENYLGEYKVFLPSLYINGVGGMPLLNNPVDYNGFGDLIQIERF